VLGNAPISFVIQSIITWSGPTPAAASLLQPLHCPASAWLCILQSALGGPQWLKQPGHLVRLSFCFGNEAVWVEHYLRTATSGKLRNSENSF
jgi:hypothetical protein